MKGNMALSPEGCGVLEHEVTCLCDVHITKPTSTQVIIPYQIVNGVALAHYGKWDGSLVHWFELMDKAWTAIHRFRDNQLIYTDGGRLAVREGEAVHDTRGQFSRTIPDEAYAYLVKRISEGGQPTPIRSELIERFGVTINKSYVTKLRGRLKERGLL